MNLDNLTCKVCKKIYNTTSRQPQFMSCGHGICLKCNEDHEKEAIKNLDGKYQCPIKNSCLQTQISKTVANYILDMLEEAEIFNIFCDKHPKNTAQYYCKSENLLICETCMLTDHSNHLKPQAHVHFNSESKDIFTRNILPYLKDKKQKLDSILESIEQSQENEITFSATKYKNLISDTKEVLIGNINDKKLVLKLDLSKQQELASQGKQPQNEEEKKDYENVQQKFKISGNLPKDQGFVMKIKEVVNMESLQVFRDLVDAELQESFLLHTAFGNQFDIEYNLLYKATEDGFSDLIYKKKCYCKDNLLIFVLSEFGQVFGGFLSEIFSQKNEYIPDKGAFLFQLTKRQLMFQYQNFQSAYYDKNGKGATFGGGHDLYLSSNCNQNSSSYSDLGHTYKPPEGINQGADQAKTYLAGQYNFKVIEIEVYQAKFNPINQ
eukprot:403350719